MFFFEKKNQKTFVRLGGCLTAGTRTGGKVFFASFFFRKKKMLALCLACLMRRVFWIASLRSQ
jgi:hypothetical protein